MAGYRCYLERSVEWRGPNQWLNMCPAWAQEMDRIFGFESNQISYAIHDIKADIARLDKEFAS